MEPDWRLIHTFCNLRWKTFLKKISMHNDDIATTRVGFKYIFMDTWEQPTGWSSFSAAKTAAFTESAGLWWAIQAAVIAFCFFLARNLENDETVALSVVPVYFIAAPTYYYWVMLSIPFLDASHTFVRDQ